MPEVWTSEGRMSREDADRLRSKQSFARDAGDICTICGNVVTWVDHLPPTAAGQPVRCFTRRNRFTARLQVDAVDIEAEEDGFHLILKTDDDRFFDFNIQDVADKLLAKADETIRPWAREGGLL